MKKRQTKSLAYTAILIAFGILIPMMMPVKIIIGPASYTLASHVPIFIGLLISLPVALFVAIGTALGFLLAGFPILIVLRALSHLLFVLVGGLVLQQFSRLLESVVPTAIFAIILNVLHGLAEFVLVVVLTVSPGTETSYIWSLVGLVGIGTLIHGLIDFYLAFFLWKFLSDKVGITLSANP